MVALGTWPAKADQYGKAFENVLKKGEEVTEQQYSENLEKRTEYRNAMNAVLGLW